MIMKIREVLPKDISQIVSIHKLNYPKYHFTTSLPDNLLYRYYQQLISCNEFCLVAENSEKEVIGFLIAGAKTKEAVNKFIFEYKIKLILLLLRHPKFLFEKIYSKIKSKLSKKSNSTNNSKVRVISIAVRKDQKRKSIGSRLLKELENILVGNNIKQYGLSVRKNNKTAINFYRKNNFSCEHHIDKSIYFKKNL